MPAPLDGKEVPIISAYFEDSEDAGEPKALPENANHVYQGSIFLGDGFLLSHEEAQAMKLRDSRLGDVVFSVTNGQEINNQPDQTPGRQILNFFDWPEEKAQTYGEAFERVEQLVKPDRMRQKDAGGQEYWWRFLRPRNELYSAIRGTARCFVAARTTKYLNFSTTPTNYVFTDALYVFTTDRWDLYAVVQSTLHEVWARKYSGALKQDLRYSPSKCFDTFPFPEGLWQTADPALATIGERYHEHRRSLMLSLWLGLTDIYNLFHSRDLTPERIAKVSKKSPAEAAAGLQGILELRRLHQELDLTIRNAYGWPDLDLGHGFHEVETLPENDRLRYTISPAARKEVLKRLLALNHQRAAAQATTTPVKPKPASKRGRKPKGDEDAPSPQGSLF